MCLFRQLITTQTVTAHATIADDDGLILVLLQQVGSWVMLLETIHVRGQNATFRLHDPGQHVNT